MMNHPENSAPKKRKLSNEPSKNRDAKEFVTCNQIPSRSVEHLYLDEDTADVHFVLESMDGAIDRIPAHKCLLASASDVLKAMFYGPAKEKGDVKLTDITVAALKEFLQFFYLHQVKLTMESFVEIMNFANKYNVTECVNIGLEFLKDTELAIDDVCTVYEVAITLGLKEIKQFCEKQIIINTQAVFESTSFLTWKHDTLSHILQLDTLSCDETDVFKACMAWTASVGRDVLSKDLIKTHLGQLFYDIRFRSMPIEEFVCLLQTYDNLFSAEEKNEVLQLIVLKNVQPKIFNGKLRQAEWVKEAIIECDRVSEVLMTFFNLKRIQTTIFSTTEPILLGEFVCSDLKVYRDSQYHDLSSDLLIDVKIFETDENLTKTLTSMKSGLSSSKKVITLTKPVLIRPGFRYTIRLKQAVEGHCFKAKLLKKIVKVNSDIEIQFYNDNNIIGDKKKLMAPITSLKFNRIQ